MKRWAAIARMGGLGDNLIAASTLRPLKKLGYNIEVITSELAHVVFQNNPFVDKLTIKHESQIPQGPEWQRWFEARGAEYDVFAHLSHTCEVRHALTPEMTAFWARPEYRRKLCAGSYLETVHDAVGVAYDFGPVFFPTEEEQARAAEVKTKIGGRYIAWVISGSRLDKIYPWSSMAIGRIIKEMNIPVVLFGTGGKQEGIARHMQEYIQKQNSTDEGLHLALGPDAADPGGAKDWPIRRSLTQALAADLVVTVDTGTAWAVAMEPMPKIMLSSHASPENITRHWVNTVTLEPDKFKVPCWPCHRLHNDFSTCVKTTPDIDAAACISNISVETVLAEVTKALQSKNVVPLRRVA